MPLYRIIGADHKEYGPVPDTELRIWIREGRANAESRLLAEGESAWRELGTFSEFFADLTAAQPMMSALVIEASSVQKNSGYAIVGFVLSLVGIPFCLIGLFSTLGLIFSVIGFFHIRRNPLRKGTGYAVSGLIISLLGLLLMAALWGAFIYGLANDFESD